MKHPIQALAAALVTALFASPAFALCSEPIEPHCADGGEVGNRYVSVEQCRAQIDDHLGSLSRYQDCLRGLIEESEAEAQRYRQLLERADSS